MFVQHKAILLAPLLGLSLVSGFEWSINHSGKQFVNIHLDPDHVRTPCKRNNTICVPISYSTLYCDLLNSADSDIEIQGLLRDLSCGFLFNEPMVCCPYGQVSEEQSCDLNGDLKSRDKLSSKPTFLDFLLGQTEPVCGERAPLPQDTVRISNGKQAPPGDWPWMVLLGYRRRGSNEPSFECGGTLITKRNVLTSAHCLDQRQVIEVRLGETDLTTTLDCISSSCVCASGCPFTSRDDCLARKECAEKHVSRGVARTAVHPKYSARTWEYDVGILTLDTAVPLSDYIRPVCLPEVPGELDQSRLWFVTGWGATSNRRVLAEILQQVQVKLTSRRSCSTLWDIPVLLTQVCAAGAEAGASVCEGDSGGPLVTRRGGVWEQGAIVSSGSSICGDTKPTFFTLINQEIFKWIAANVDGKLPGRPTR